jgi:hypothetical protein
MDVRQMMQILDRFKLDGLICVCKSAFKGQTAVKMIFDDAFAAIGDDKDVGDTCGNSFFNDVLDRGLIDDGQHFFRHSFGCSLRLAFEFEREEYRDGDIFTDGDDA